MGVIFQRNLGKNSKEILRKKKKNSKEICAKWTFKWMSDMWSAALCTLGVTKPICNCLSFRQQQVLPGANPPIPPTTAVIILRTKKKMLLFKLNFQFIICVIFWMQLKALFFEFVCLVGQWDSLIYPFFLPPFALLSQLSMGNWNYEIR